MFQPPRRTFRDRHALYRQRTARADPPQADALPEPRRHTAQPPRPRGLRRSFAPRRKVLLRQRQRSVYRRYEPLFPERDRQPRPVLRHNRKNSTGLVTPLPALRRKRYCGEHFLPDNQHQRGHGQPLYRRTDKGSARRQPASVCRRERPHALLTARVHHGFLQSERVPRSGRQRRYRIIARRKASKRAAARCVLAARLHT